MDLFKNYSLFYKGVLFALFLLFLFIPSVDYADYNNSTITSKTIFFLYALIITLGFCMLQMISDNSKLLVFKVSRLDVLLTLLLIFVSVNRYFFQPNYGFSIRYIELLGLSVLYVILRRLYFNSFVWLLLAITLSGIIQAGYGSLQLLDFYRSNHNGFKITGSFFNPGPYAGFLAAVWSIALGTYLFKEFILKQTLLLENKSSPFGKTGIRYVLEYVPLIGIVSIALVLPATQSRASWLAVLISSAILLEFRYRVLKNILNKTTVLKKRLLIAILFIILGLGLFGIYHIKKGSSDGRLFIWKITTKMIKDHPFFGVGFDRFKAHYMNYQAHYFAENGDTPEVLVADGVYYAFNAFIQFVSENGLIGLGLLVIVLYSLYRTVTTKKNKNLLIVVKTSLLTVSVFGLFSYPMTILPIKIILVCLVAMAANLDSKKITLLKQTKTNFELSPIKYLVIIIIGLSIVKATDLVIKLHAGFKVWDYAIRSYDYRDYESAINGFKEVYPLFKNDGDFLMDYGKALSYYGQDLEAVSIVQRAKTHININGLEITLGDSYKNLKQYKKAEQAYRHAANMIPARFYPLYLLIKLYEESGQNKKALATAKAILNKDIKIPSTAVNQIRLNTKTIIDKIQLNENTKKSPLGLKI
ncbi:hypothetical protein PW52_07940 [Tamlana sedimentorum]|uniref:O-antigen ligase-related domain-containing protein n=1 Tax=Neotamlana sedimentorum TaxID=1435349 RepID=A0A0D7WD46_9FLAO|nr:O-antigen ligase family protein [Tamlana sedimentorum]KJD35667.1 hypothetical protein PW52_07940 [Tamlana sedimentorum]